MSVSLVGGVLLILGAWFTYIGNIYYAIGAYFLADICWVIISYGTGDVIGGTFIIIGMTLGFLVFLKMHRGEFHKTLKKDD
jgi:hypothetical protein